MFTLLANETAESLRTFLASVLPDISPDWWNSTVISALSFQQQRMVEEKQVITLSGLDLAALLRVLDKSWYEISSKRNLGNEARSWTREMQHVRNKWAHAAGHPPETEDTYRDLDTLQRFLGAIHADSSLVDKVREKKLNCMASPPQQAITPLIPLHPEQITAVSEFVLGDLVCLKSDPNITGAVIQVIQAQPENRYLVFAGTKPTPYYASQLVKCDVSDDKDSEPVSLEAFHAHLTALHLQHPGLAKRIYLGAIVLLADEFYQPLEWVKPLEKTEAILASIEAQLIFNYKPELNSHHVHRNNATWPVSLHIQNFSGVTTFLHDTHCWPMK